MCQIEGEYSHFWLDSAKCSCKSRPPESRSCPELAREEAWGQQGDEGLPHGPAGGMWKKKAGRMAPAAAARERSSSASCFQFGSIVVSLAGR